MPRSHVYVDHLSPIGRADGVSRLADPAVPGARPGQWWPPAMLSAAWIEANAARFDVFHLHFGFDALDPADLSDLLDALDVAGRPLVYTVHDLRNPHHLGPAQHDAHLDVLIPRAAELVTLSAGAADEIERRWGRRPLVLPHPHVVPLARMARSTARATTQFHVGLHLKSVRPNAAALQVTTALVPLVTQLSGLQLHVNLHHDVADADGSRHDPVLMGSLRGWAARGLIQLAVHGCFTDDELWDYLQALDLSVLPYRFGTHSGWLEACHDLGTPVLAPTCGYYADQRPCITYRHDESALDVQSLQDGVRTAYRQRRRPRVTVRARLTERDEIAAAHRAIYESVLQ